jgi:hypothetical protein
MFRKLIRPLLAAALVALLQLLALASAARGAAASPRSDDAAGVNFAGAALSPAPPHAAPAPPLRQGLSTADLLTLPGVPRAAAWLYAGWCELRRLAGGDPVIDSSPTLDPNGGGGS